MPPTAGTNSNFRLGTWRTDARYVPAIHLLGGCAVCLRGVERRPSRVPPEDAPEVVC